MAAGRRRSRPQHHHQRGRVERATGRPPLKAATIVLTSPDRHGQTCTLAGPDPLTGPATAACADALGRPVTCLGDDLQQFEDMPIAAHVVRRETDAVICRLRFRIS